MQNLRFRLNTILVANVCHIGAIRELLRRCGRSIGAAGNNWAVPFVSLFQTLEKAQKRLLAIVAGVYLYVFLNSAAGLLGNKDTILQVNNAAGATLTQASIECLAIAVLGVVLSFAAVAVARERLRFLEALRHQALVSNELQQEIEERRVLFDTSKNLIFITDADGQVVRVAPSSEPILGFSPIEMLGQSSLSFLAEADIALAKDEMRKARHDLATRFFEARLTHKSGRLVTIAWSCAWSQSEKKYFCIGRDRTEIIERECVISEQNTKLDLALANMSQGLLMVDSVGRVQLFNGRFIAMFHVSPNTFNGTTTIEDLARHAGYVRALALNPDGNLFEKFASKCGTLTELVEQCELADGRTVYLKITPLDGGGVLATFEDISDLQSALKSLGQKNVALAFRESELGVKHLQLDAAINNMNQGLSMFDAQGKLILCNDQVLTMYGLGRSDVKIGMSLSDIASIRLASGVGSKELSDKAYSAYMAALKDPKLSNFVTRMFDGRAISISCQSMLHGGWVITHRDVTLELEREARIVHLARHDTLTDLPNRVVLSEVLDAEFARCQRGQMAALHFLDLDDFKSVNDTLGHAVGDKLLLAVADRLRKCVRATDTVVRLGGDEFAIVQSDVKAPEDAIGLAKRLISALGAPYEIEGSAIVRGTSIGIALAPADGSNAVELLKHSDLALYQAKELGRGGYQFFETALNLKMQNRRQIEDDLRHALARSEFELHYQPMVSMHAGKIKGAEALLRWRHPERGLVSPLDFIPIAEETGLIHSIGEWVIREACSQAAQWPKDIRVAVNLSPLQFQRTSVVSIVADALAISRLEPHRLELEITESLLLDANDSILQLLHQFRGLGVGIALDDFGTGYSSLSYLQSFPFTILKIDRSFI